MNNLEIAMAIEEFGQETARVMHVHGSIPAMCVCVDAKALQGGHGDWGIQVVICNAIAPDFAIEVLEKAAAKLRAMVSTQGN